MEMQKVILWAALVFVLMLIWQAWQQDYGPRPPQPAASSKQQAADGDKPAAGDELPEVPSSETPVAQVQEALKSGQRIRVRTDVLDLEIDTLGGDLRRVDLPGYPVSIEQPDIPLRLMADSDGRLFVLQSGLLPADSQSTAVDHHALYSAEKSEYLLQEDQEELQVRLEWKDSEGLQVSKVFVFTRGSYAFDVRYEVTNVTDGEWRGHLYHQLQRTPPVESKNIFMMHTYTGGVISGINPVTNEELRYEKIGFEDMVESPVNRDMLGGWEAMIQHYFLVATIPGQEEINHFYSKRVAQNRYVLGMVSKNAQVVPAGSSGQFGFTVYAGPKLKDELERLAPHLELTVDYGFLTILANPLFWLLQKIHALVGNWGWAIIILTIIIKLAFFPLSAASYRSMANMRKLTPRLKSIKERYADDKEGYQRAMMDLYKKEKINPLGGCLPILVQIPVFIALYWVLLESVELRQAPWIGWIKDLSIKDPYYVLPLIMGASMFAQYKLNPQPPDPLQAKIMMYMPIVFTVFFLFFPAGLVLYWVVNNVLSIAQQWYITHQMEKTG